MAGPKIKKSMILHLLSTQTIPVEGLLILFLIAALFISQVFGSKNKKAKKKIRKRKKKDVSKSRSSKKNDLLDKPLTYRDLRKIKAILRK